MRMMVDRRLFLLSAAAVPLYAGPLVTFSDEEAKLISALTDAIIPADDSLGAVAAGVVFYIDRQLAGPLKRYRAAYRSGMARFAAFLEMSAPARLEFLKQRESDPFFAMLVDHTMQGFYGSPEHGGNREEASWKMLGIQDVMEGHRH